MVSHLLNLLACRLANRLSFPQQSHPHTRPINRLAIPALGLVGNRVDDHHLSRLHIHPRSQPANHRRNLRRRHLEPQPTTQLTNQQASRVANPQVLHLPAQPHSHLSNHRASLRECPLISRRVARVFNRYLSHRPNQRESQVVNLLLFLLVYRVPNHPFAQLPHQVVSLADVPVRYRRLTRARDQPACLLRPRLYLLALNHPVSRPISLRPSHLGALP